MTDRCYYERMDWWNYVAIATAFFRFRQQSLNPFRAKPLSSLPKSELIQFCGSPQFSVFELSERIKNASSNCDLPR
jgi:hypothetical protein